jgi:hypothetical protein
MPVAARETKIPVTTALAGTPAGGVYEFAGACDQIALIDEGSCVVSPAEVSRLKLLRGAPGVRARVVDQPPVRGDRAHRFVGPETLETKVFGRLAAWQNWIFTRPNASGPDGALRRFGTGRKGDFDFERV